MRNVLNTDSIFSVSNATVMQYVVAARETVVIGRAGWNIMAQGLSTPVPTLSPYTHFSLKRKVMQQLHYGQA